MILEIVKRRNDEEFCARAQKLREKNTRQNLIRYFSLVNNARTLVENFNTIPVITIIIAVLLIIIIIIIKK